MILIGRGLNHEAGVSGGEGSTPSRKIPKEAESRSSVQVNSNCAVVKVRITVSGRKIVRTHAAKAEGENGEFSNEAETGWTKAEGGKSGEGTESRAGGSRSLKRSGTGKRRTGSKESEPKAAGESEELSNKAEGKGEARKRIE